MMNAKYTHHRTYTKTTGEYFSHVFQNENGSFSGSLWGGYNGKIDTDLTTDEFSTREKAQEKIEEEAKKIK
jgi:hypothetical protein